MKLGAKKKTLQEIKYLEEVQAFLKSKKKAVTVTIKHRPTWSPCPTSM